MRNEYIQQTISDLIGIRYEGACLSRVDLSQREATALLEWCKKLDSLFLIQGSPGCGKTYFCSALLAYLGKKIDSARYFDERQLLSRLRSAIGDRYTDGDYLDALNFLSDSQLIILDDLGASDMVTGWRKEVLLDFLDRRYAQCKPTLITTTISDYEMKKRFGESLFSRLYSKENLVFNWKKRRDLRGPTGDCEDVRAPWCDILGIETSELALSQT